MNRNRPHQHIVRSDSISSDVCTVDLNDPAVNNNVEQPSSSSSSSSSKDHHHQHVAFPGVLNYTNQNVGREPMKARNNVGAKFPNSAASEDESDGDSSSGIVTDDSNSYGGYPDQKTYDAIGRQTEHEAMMKAYGHASEDHPPKSDARKQKNNTTTTQEQTAQSSKSIFSSIGDHLRSTIYGNTDESTSEPPSNQPTEEPRSKVSSMIALFDKNQPSTETKEKDDEQPSAVSSKIALFEKGSVPGSINDAKKSPVDKQPTPSDPRWRQPQSLRKRNVSHARTVTGLAVASPTLTPSRSSITCRDVDEENSDEEDDDVILDLVGGVNRDDQSRDDNQSTTSGGELSAKKSIFDDGLMKVMGGLSTVKEHQPMISEEPLHRQTFARRSSLLPTVSGSASKTTGLTGTQREHQPMKPEEAAQRQAFARKSSLLSTNSDIASQTTGLTSSQRANKNWPWRNNHHNNSSTKPHNGVSTRRTSSPLKDTITSAAGILPNNDKKYHINGSARHVPKRMATGEAREDAERHRGNNSSVSLVQLQEPPGMSTRGNPDRLPDPPSLPPIPPSPPRLEREPIKVHTAKTPDNLPGSIQIDNYESPLSELSSGPAAESDGPTLEAKSPKHNPSVALGGYNGQTNEFLPEAGVVKAAKMSLGLNATGSRMASSDSDRTLGLGAVQRSYRLHPSEEESSTEKARSPKRVGQDPPSSGAASVSSMSSASSSSRLRTRLAGAFDNVILRRLLQGLTNASTDDSSDEKSLEEEPSPTNSTDEENSPKTSISAEDSPMTSSMSTSETTPFAPVVADVSSVATEEDIFPDYPYVNPVRNDDHDDEDPSNAQRIGASPQSVAVIDTVRHENGDGLYYARRRRRCCGPSHIILLLMVVFFVSVAVAVSSLVMYQDADNSQPNESGLPRVPIPPVSPPPSPPPSAMPVTSSLDRPYGSLGTDTSVEIPTSSPTARNMSMPSRPPIVPPTQAPTVVIFSADNVGVDTTSSTNPSTKPSRMPSSIPTIGHSKIPSASPSKEVSDQSQGPSQRPSRRPVANSSQSPSARPSAWPSSTELFRQFPTFSPTPMNTTSSTSSNASSFVATIAPSTPSPSPDNATLFSTQPPTGVSITHQPSWSGTNNSSVSPSAAVAAPVQDPTAVPTEHPIICKDSQVAIVYTGVRSGGQSCQWIEENPLQAMVLCTKGSDASRSCPVACGWCN